MSKDVGLHRTAIVVGAAILLLVALACTRTVEVPGETVVVEKEVVKTVEVEVPGGIVTEQVVKTVEVPGETIVVEKEVIKTVEVPGETVVVEKEVVKTVEVPGETVVVERIVVATVAPTEEMSAGELVISLADVGPPLYYGPKIACCYDSRNVQLGIFDALLATDGEKPLAQIATSWSLGSTDLTLKIRNDVPFHNPIYGNVTAEDVVWTWTETTKEGTINTQASSPKRGYAKYEVVDENTVRFEFKGQPTLDWASSLGGAGAGFGIESKEYFQDNGENFVLLNENGTGPYKVVSQRTDDHINLEAIPNHWRKTPAFQTMKVLEVPEEATRIAQLRTGEVDITRVSMPVVGQVKSIPGVKFVTGRWRGNVGATVYPGGNYHLKTDPRTGDPLQNFPDLPWVGDTDDPASMESARKIRKAMSYAIDRQAIIDTILNGEGSPLYQYGMVSSNPRWKHKWDTPYDPDKARQLLEEAGFPDGFDFPFFIPAAFNPTMEEVGEAIVPMWQAVGIRAKIEKDAYQARRPGMVARNFPTVFIFPHGDRTPPFDLLNGMAMTGGLQVWNAGLVWPTAHDLAKRLQQEIDVEKQWDIIDEYMNWQAEEQIVIGVVGFREPWSVGPRIASWDMPAHGTLWPTYVENILPAR